jgi:hypothetical protein
MDNTDHSSPTSGQVLNYLRGNLPAGSTAVTGSLAYVTDDIRGLWVNNGASFIPLLGSTVNVRDHGAQGDLRSVTDAVTQSTTSVSSATAAFTSADLAKAVYIVQSDGSSHYYGTCAAFVSPTTITLNAAVPFSGTSCTLWIATDDKPAFQNAVTALASTRERGSIFIPAGSYFLSGPVLIKNTSNVLMTGQGAASIIYYSSDNDALLKDADLVSNEMAQSAFVVKDSDYFTAQHLAFVGGSSRNISTIQIGACYYFTSCAHPTIAFCDLSYGASLVRQDNNPDDIGCRVLFNRCYGARRPIIIGDDSLIQGNYFELPATDGYDRIDQREGSSLVAYGSSHAIYQFAGRERTSVVGNHFKNIREVGVKFSGTSLAVRSCIVQNNIFDDCGCGVEFGDDTSNQITHDHSDLICVGNDFRNCGTNKHGWRAGGAVGILGCKSAIISNNGFFYNRDAVGTAGGVSAIGVARYSQSNAAPVESIEIGDNIFTGLVGSGGASSAAQILTEVISVESVGQGLGQQSTYTTGVSSVRIQGNTIRSVGGIGIHAIGNIGLIVTGNVFNAITTPISLQGNRLPVICNNLLIPGPVTTNDTAQLRFNKDSFPIFYDNYTQQRGSYDRLMIRGWTVSTDGSPIPSSVWPVPGKRGLLVPTLGKPEVVFGFGDGWADNDTITVASDVGTATFTYKATITDATAQFNTSTNLIMAINANPTISAMYMANDYGDPWGVQTHHIKISRRTVTQTPNVFYITVHAASLTAGVVLPNEPSILGNNLRCFARGEQSSDGKNRQAVVWSPQASPHSIPHLIGAASTAAEYLAAGYYRGSSDLGSSIQINFTNPKDPTVTDNIPLQFECLLGS